jgi:flavin reductase (DIM6/NTAB) family NADH-FMN oxidoreductase RutF
MEFKPYLREGFMPLPVALVSSISGGGIRNVAPYSCVMPVLRPLDLICLASAHRRDTLHNIRTTGEFVVNLAGKAMVDKIIPTAKHSAPEVDEFVEADLIPRPSTLVRPPGIQGCYAWMECRLHTQYTEKDYVLIMGKILRLEVEDACVTDEGLLDVRVAQPLLMLGDRQGMHFSTVGEPGLFEPFAAMFRNGQDPLAGRYQRAGHPGQECPGGRNGSSRRPSLHQ